MDNPNQIKNMYGSGITCCEFYPEKKVTEKDLLKILNEGRSSPSSFGFEPWKFLVIEREYLKEKIASISWGIQIPYNQLNHLVIILARKSKSMIYHSSYIRYMMEEIQNIPDDIVNLRLDRYKNFLEEDFKLLDDDRAMFDWASKQTYIALSNMIAEASKLGIGSCPIEGFHKEKLENLLEKEGIIDTDEYGVSIMVTFGYMKSESTREKKRRPFREVVEWIR